MSGGDDVEIRKGWLDHDHVGAFRDVEVDFAHSLAHVCRIHLVRAAVAELRSGGGRFAEWSVEAGGELGCVRKNGRVDAAGSVEGAADGCDTSVHHVGWRNHVDASAGKRDRRTR